jgi:type IV secretion system protein VirB6
MPVVVAANDTGGASSSTTTRETKVFATSSGNGQIAPASAAASRTRGIGNRFRSASSAGAALKSETRK